MALKDQAMAKLLLELFDVLLAFNDWPCHMYGEDENGDRLITV